eukprot:916210-Rhodomonas_salina.1
MADSAPPPEAPASLNRNSTSLAVSALSLSSTPPPLETAEQFAIVTPFSSSVEASLESIAPPTSASLLVNVAFYRVTLEDKMLIAPPSSWAEQSVTSSPPNSAVAPYSIASAPPDPHPPELPALLAVQTTWPRVLSTPPT